MRLREIKVNKNDSNQRLDKFLHKLMPSLPNALLYKYLRKKCIRINAKHITDGATMLNCGDVITLYISDEFFNDSTETPNKSVNLPAPDIVYEDDNIILLNKEAGISVHPDEKQKDGTLVDIMIAYLKKKGEYICENEQSFVPSLCNRIDRNTCGIVIGAKNAESLREMNLIIKERQIEKRYLCLVHGVMQKKVDTLKNFLLKDSAKNEVTVFDKPVPDAKTAILDYKLINTKKLPDGSDVSLLEVLLHTGRTHQIRAQLAHIGHSIVGDGKYGKSYGDDKKNGYRFQALCAYKLRFSLSGEFPLLSYLNGKEFSINCNF